MNLNYLKDKHGNSLLELLQEYKKMFDGTLGKYTDFDYTIQSLIIQNLFLFQQL